MSSSDFHSIGYEVFKYIFLSFRNEFPLKLIFHSSSLQVSKVKVPGSKEIYYSNLAFVRRYSRVRWYKGWRWEESRIIPADTKTTTQGVFRCRHRKLCSHV